MGGIFDIASFNGEYDLLEIRLNILDDFVDQFVIVEFDKTFSGQPKESYFLNNSKRYEKWRNKISYSFLNESTYGKYYDLAKSSPNTTGASHWVTEFAMKESIKDTLEHLKDDDLCFVGDVDEIWNPELKFTPTPLVWKLGLKVYTYYLNNRSSEVFYGTIVTEYANIKSHCLNHLRTFPDQRLENAGWHFTSMGGYAEVKRKLENSYTRESYWTPQVEAGLEDNLVNSKDFLGRDFQYWLDESEWPIYLKANRKKYAHLTRAG